MTNSALLSARYATVARASVYAHREEDSEFAKMWDEAVEQNAAHAKDNTVSPT
jgi:hypothetical protein